MPKLAVFTKRQRSSLRMTETESIQEKARFIAMAATVWAVDRSHLYDD
ncbi:hypothetical protein TIFTF001_002444 [Ficus carica]|uniref:Uncharacterized protein n=1 Tax=Ficus carica TaxID=3494 RepID=A0AA87ZBH0_FICCA|nr:hypothetical protein TIFTF001_002444 [Ficus carica]